MMQELVDNSWYNHNFEICYLPIKPHGNANESELQKIET